MNSSIPAPVHAPQPTAASAEAVKVMDHSLPRMLRERTPAPTPVPTPAPRPVIHRTPIAIPANSYSPNSIEGIIAAAAQRWGVSASWMIGIARCESGLRPNAYNPHGPYYGLFQFLMSTFTHNGGTNIWNPADQANIAAKMLAHGQAYQWSCA
ncbi:MAG: transglycosylase SLT domain-containing protein [Candidatus Dormibacteraeota bacterium]|nr:transglycosylase SLT domain-containing protein [Candidatus Dormibacteraeota bacterium]